MKDVRSLIDTRLFRIPDKKVFNTRHWKVLQKMVSSI